ncbi:peptide-methionine (S)-S-oxide reductase MsrA [Paracoccus sp. Z118]|uniref:peptide-methionine (S)-S-oxide reductase MsrA n=1 Tax=Paracoccus sp. Z118 TaxID=2851017 RepID=UPI001C2B8854|nr:peptide-methionine (S)-S-oxide reductase MsrA [Paracoccus sp. Z118]MBV0891902.1 peptide-methionine (S)-S-oxide reductase MsrA [Paracoccus sp. Z118]
MTQSLHAIFGRPMGAPVPQGYEEVVLGMGCYWGVERLFWELDGVWLTEVGFAGGSTPNPTYRQVCAGGTGHAEVVRVVYDPSRISFEHILKIFWENHNPTQGNRQGNDVGDQYRSVIFTTTATQQNDAELSRVDYDNRLAVAGHGGITTQIAPLDRFWIAPEIEHQQYLHKVPNGYCGLRGTGVEASMPSAALEAAIDPDGDGSADPRPAETGRPSGGATAAVLQLPFRLF